MHYLNLNPTIPIFKISDNHLIGTRDISWINVANQKINF